MDKCNSVDEGHMSEIHKLTKNLLLLSVSTNKFTKLTQKNNVLISIRSVRIFIFRLVILKPLRSLLFIFVKLFSVIIKSSIWPANVWKSSILVLLSVLNFDGHVIVILCATEVVQIACIITVISTSYRVLLVFESNLGLFWVVACRFSLVFFNISSYARIKLTFPNTFLIATNILFFEFRSMLNKINILSSPSSRLI